MSNLALAGLGLGLVGAGGYFLGRHIEKNKKEDNNNFAWAQPQQPQIVYLPQPTAAPVKQTENNLIPVQMQTPIYQTNNQYNQFNNQYNQIPNFSTTNNINYSNLVSRLEQQQNLINQLTASLQNQSPYNTNTYSNLNNNGNYFPVYPNNLNGGLMSASSSVPIHIQNEKGQEIAIIFSSQYV